MTVHGVSILSLPSAITTIWKFERDAMTTFYLLSKILYATKKAVLETSGSILNILKFVSVTFNLC
jgi:hypothetical protein